MSMKLEDEVPHGTPEMLFQEIASTASGAAFHAEMAAQYASVGNVQGTVYAVRCLVSCTKAIAASTKDLLAMAQVENPK
ncbi:MAG TPA: hypothetical protein VEZ24_09945 [Microvirga sp.]|nr:hypothetical protein [Microvirga sp.]